MSDLLDLTVKDVRILELLCDGMTDKEIAHALGTTPGNAKNLVHDMVHRLGAKNRTQAAARYVALTMAK